MRRPDPARFAAARDAFEELVELDPAACDGALVALRTRDSELAAAVEELLFADAQSAGLLDQPAAAAVPGLVEAWLDGEPSLAQGVVLGGWRLVEPLGRGGMGEVWGVEREDGEIVQRAALKLLKRGMDSDEVVRRFRRERQIVARLDHPGIARLIDGGVAADGRLFLVLERVDGRPITEAARGLGVAARVDLILDACDAVAAAHARLVVHRDLKPSNILVEGAGRVRLLDFGIAKLLDEEESGATALTRADARPLTPAYAAPEQILGEPVTTATDVYALGVVLFELLVGRAPFRRERASALELASAVERETVPRASRLAAEAGDRRLSIALSGDLDTILAKALAREPERRYPTVAAFADDLRRFLDGLPVAARPDTLGYRTRKFVGRHRASVAAATVAALALVAGLAVSIVQTGRAERAAARAERVRTLLTSVFEASDPVVARGEEPTVRQLLAGGAERIERELVAEPELAAEMLDLLASLQRKLGALAEARRLAERSLTLREELFGAESVEAARSAWTLGWILLNQGEFDAARAELERAVARLDRAGGAVSVAAADAREPMVELAFASNGPAAAEPLAQERLAIYRRELGEDDWRTGLAWSDVGVVLFEQGKLDEAEAALLRAAAIFARTLPPDDPRRAYPHNNLSSVYIRKGDFNAAEREAKAAIELRTRTLGPEHPETAISIGHLVYVDLEKGRFVEAEAGARRALAIFTGKDSFNAANAEAVLAQALDHQGRSAEALARFDSAIAQLDAIVGEGHIVTINPRVHRAVALANAGRPAEARAELERLRALLTGMGGTGAEALGKVERELGRLDVPDAGAR